MDQHRGGSGLSLAVGPVAGEGATSAAVGRCDRRPRPAIKEERADAPLPRSWAEMPLLRPCLAMTNVRARGRALGLNAYAT